MVFLKVLKMSLLIYITNIFTNHITSNVIFFKIFFYKKKQNFIKFKNNGAEAPHYIAQVRFNYKEIMSYTTPTSSVVLRTT